MARMLCIDYGTRRCGIAVTDILQIAVHPVDTIATKDLWDWLEKYLLAETVESIIIGHPLHHDGSEVSFSHQITGLIRKINKFFPRIQTVLQDEAHSSVRAREAILYSGAKKTKRRDKALVDKIAAVIILQDYLGHV